jgi:carbon starvation protein CstA
MGERMAEEKSDMSAVGMRIQQSLQQVETQTARLRKTNTILVVFGVVNSAVATLVTALTAAVGPFIGEGPAGWRISCIIGAVFAFGSTVCVGLDKQLKTTDKLAQTHQVLGRLRVLDMTMLTGSRSHDEITSDFEDLMKMYPEIIA